MPAAKRLVVSCAFGASLKETVLLARHPDESHDEQGHPLPDARTLVLALEGKRAVFRDVVPAPLISASYSTSGTAYCGSLHRRVLYTWRAGRWSEETFSDKPVAVARYVYAFPGSKPEDDTVFVAGDKRVFVRQRNKWQSKRVPGEAQPYQIEGSRADQVFVGGIDLFVWDGAALNELEAPEDDMIQFLALSADDRLIGGSTYVNASTEDGKWERIETPVEGFFGFARLAKDVYALSDEDGIFRVYPGKPKKVVTRGIDPLGFVSVGDGLIAFGREGVQAFDGKTWFDVDVPSCVAGRTPK